MSVGAFGLCCCQPATVTCPACSSQDMAGGTVEGVWTPTLENYEELAFGGAGRYAVMYCGGAAGHTALIGTDAMPGKPSSTGFFSVWETVEFIYGAHAWKDSQWVPPWRVIALSYGKGGFYADPLFPPAPPFTATNPAISQLPGDTNYSVADDIAGAQNAQQRLRTAMASVSNCNMYRFRSDGTAPVSLQFTAPLYKDDIWPVNPGDPSGPANGIRLASGISAPKFAVVKLTPLFTAKQSCGFGNTGSNRYVLNLTFRNDSDFLWDGVASLSGGGINVEIGQGQAWSVAPHSQTQTSFQITVASKNVTVTLTLSDSIGEIQKLKYDITPTLLSVAVVSNGVSFNDPNRNRLTISIGNSNGLPFNDIRFTVSMSGGVIGLYDAIEGTPLPSTVDTHEALNCSAASTSFALDIVTATVRPASVQFSFQVLDEGTPIAQPPFSFLVPLLWT